MATALREGELGYIDRFILDLPAGQSALDVIARSVPIQDAIADVLQGRSENDRFNELLIAAALDERAIVLFRTLFCYLLQTGLFYRLTTSVDALRREHGIARDLVHLFGARHKPSRSGLREKNTIKAPYPISIDPSHITATNIKEACV